MENHKLPPGLLAIIGVHVVAAEIIAHLPRAHDIESFSLTCRAALSAVQLATFSADDRSIVTPGGLRCGAYLRLSVPFGQQDATSYEHQALVAWGTFVSVYLERHRLRVLHLSRVPMLTVKGLSRILRFTTQLTDVGIYQCPLIDFGDTTALVNGVHWASGVAGRHIKLDFFPRFHAGPQGEDRTDTYGVTWSDPGVDISTAILDSCHHHHFPVAASLGRLGELVGSGAAFRKWLCALPLRYDVGGFLDGCASGGRDWFVPFLSGSDALRHLRHPDRKVFCLQCSHNKPAALVNHQMVSERGVRGVVCRHCQLGLILYHEQDHYKISTKEPGRWVAKGAGQMDHAPVGRESAFLSVARWRARRMDDDRALGRQVNVDGGEREVQAGSFAVRGQIDRRDWPWERSLSTAGYHG